MNINEMIIIDEYPKPYGFNLVIRYHNILYRDLKKQKKTVQKIVYYFKLLSHQFFPFHRDVSHPPEPEEKLDGR